MFMNNLHIFHIDLVRTTSDFQKSGLSLPVLPYMCRPHSFIILRSKYTIFESFWTTRLRKRLGWHKKRWLIPPQNISPVRSIRHVVWVQGAIWILLKSALLSKTQIAPFSILQLHSSLHIRGLHIAARSTEF